MDLLAGPVLLPQPGSESAELALIQRNAWREWMATRDNKISCQYIKHVFPRAWSSPNVIKSVIIKGSLLETG